MALVVFDLDGTLIDSRQDLADSTNAVLTSLRAAALPSDQVVMMVGEGARVLVRSALTAAGLDADGPALDDALGRFHAVYRSRLLATTKPYPGISEMLADVAPLATLAMLTNKPLVPSQQAGGCLRLDLAVHEGHRRRWRRATQAGSPGTPAVDGACGCRARVHDAGRRLDGGCGDSQECRRRHMCCCLRLRSGAG